MAGIIVSVFQNEKSVGLVRFPPNGRVEGGVY